MLQATENQILVTKQKGDCYSHIIRSPEVGTAGLVQHFENASKEPGSSLPVSLSLVCGFMVVRWLYPYKALCPQKEVKGAKGQGNMPTEYVSFENLCQKLFHIGIGF